MNQFLDGRVTLHAGDCRDVIRGIADNSIDSVVTDPPYALVSISKRFGKDGSAPAKVGATGAYARASAGFMGKQWDTGEAAFADEFWAEVFRVLKPGGHVLAFGGTRTYHRLACAIEDAGFEIRDQIGWLYGSGFPKSHNVSKGMDDARCRCATPERGMRQVRNADVSQARTVESAVGKVLLPIVQEQGAPIERWSESPGAQGGGQPGMEGRGNASATSGKLRVGSIRPLPSGIPADGAQGRLHHAASSRDGEVDGAAAHEVGNSSSSGSRPAEQFAPEFGTMADECGPQARGVWPVCGGCGKPIVPDGLGTALKPAWEPIVMARKPLVGTVAQNVLEHGTGALNIDGCRVEAYSAEDRSRPPRTANEILGGGKGTNLTASEHNEIGRWPANIIHDGSDEVISAFPDTDSGGGPAVGTARTKANVYGDPTVSLSEPYGSNSGSAARFFYSAKADADDRIGSKHPTVKPVDLMQYLVRLVTPKGGVVLDPFAGTGTTGEAAFREGMRAILIEREPEYLADIERRMELARSPAKRAAVAAGKGKLQGAEGTPLFDF